jgi:hypothetical protein
MLHLSEHAVETAASFTYFGKMFRPALQINGIPTGFLLGAVFNVLYAKLWDRLPTNRMGVEPLTRRSKHDALHIYSDVCFHCAMNYRPPVYGQYVNLTEVSEDNIPGLGALERLDVMWIRLGTQVMRAIDNTEEV